MFLLLEINTLMLFWPMLGQRKTSLVVFLCKMRTSSVVVLTNIIYNGLYQAIRNNIVAKKTTELVLLFRKKTTELVFLWPNMSQKSIKVLISKKMLFHVLFFMCTCFILTFEQK